jgi:hypothetical protein
VLTTVERDLMTRAGGINRWPHPKQKPQVSALPRLSVAIVVWSMMANT